MMSISLKRKAWTFLLFFVLLCWGCASAPDIISKETTKGETYSADEVRRVTVDQPSLLSGDYFREKKQEKTVDLGNFFSKNESGSGVSGGRLVRNPAGLPAGWIPGKQKGIEIVPGLRLHNGWDVWDLDVIEAASMVYGDDNAGFWLKGSYDNIAFSTAWLKFEENDFQNEATKHSGAQDDDRDLIAGYFDYKFDGTDRNKIRFFYAYDRIRSVPSLDLLGGNASAAGLADYAGIYGNNGSGAASSPDTDAHTVGGYYLGKLGMFEMMAEGAYKFGSADETGLRGVHNGREIIQYDDFDISSYALAADIGLEFKDLVGWHSLRPHIGMIYTSGDDDPSDDKLGGYSGATNAHRFLRAWSGENTIIGDTNFVLGTALYGYRPGFYGNGTPVFVGGLQNFAGRGNGRGDNPGLTMYSMGITLRPKIYLIYRTNVNMFYWNEDFYVSDMVYPFQDMNGDGVGDLVSGMKKAPTLVESGFAGTEWDNEITLALSKNMFIKAQAAFFFPGEAVKSVTAALSGGTESDETAVRIATELIWNF